MLEKRKADLSHFIKYQGTLRETGGVNKSPHVTLEMKISILFGVVRLIWVESGSGQNIVGNILPGDTRVERSPVLPTTRVKSAED